MHKYKRTPNRRFLSRIRHISTQLTALRVVLRLGMEAQAKKQDESARQNGSHIGPHCDALLLRNGMIGMWHNLSGCGSDSVALNVTSSRRVLLFATHVQFRTVENFLFPDNCISS